MDNLILGIHRKRQLYLDDAAAGAGHVGLDGLLDCAVSVVEHDGDVALVEEALGEGPGGALEDDGGGGGGVVDDGDLVDVVGVDELFDESPGLENAGLEVVKVEVVGLAEVLELEKLLGLYDGGRTAAEAAVVDAGDGGVVVGEL